MAIKDLQGYVRMSRDDEEPTVFTVEGTGRVGFVYVGAVTFKAADLGKKYRVRFEEVK